MSAEQLLDEALGCWRGEAVGEGAELEGCNGEVMRLGERRLAACEWRLDAWLALGRDHDVAVEAERLLEEHALREGLWAKLMVALYRLGRQADALEAYQRARRVLGDELGLEPGPELRDLQARILRHEIPTERRATSAIGNLPARVTSFVGREAELGELDALLGRARLVTLVGVGGAGKTRLALEVAGRHRARQRVPAWFVDLAPVTDPRLVPGTVRTALGVPELPDQSPLAALTGRLAAQRALLVVDNCEHLADACAELALGLLKACPDLVVLATSRRTLGIAGETTYTVPPLAMPDSHTPGWRPELIAGYDAVRLFLERGRAARSDRPIPPRQLDTVATICRQLDGLPLEIEFAAARLRSMSVNDIAAAMKDRLGLLTEGHRVGPGRHRTLRAAIDWSHELLDPDAQLLLRRLGVFAGGFTSESLRAVCSEGLATPLDALDALVGASLVVAEPDHDSMRYRLYETVREYASERLTASTDSAAIAERHARYFCDLAERAATELVGPAERYWFGRLAIEQDNVRAALRWAADANPEVLARLAVTLGLFWRLRGNLAEGSEWLGRALNTATDPHSRAGLLIRLGDIKRVQSDFDQARDLLREGVDLACELGETYLLGFGLQGIASTYKSQGQYDLALPLHAEAAALRDSIGDRAGAAMSWGSIAEIASWQGRYEEAEPAYERGLAMMRQAGTTAGIVAYLHSMAELAFNTGDPTRAEALALEALPLAEEIGEAWHISLIHLVLAWIARARGDADHGFAHATLALEHGWDLQEMASVTDAIEALAGPALDNGDAERAALLLTGADQLRQARGVPLRATAIRARRDADLATAAELLGPRFESIQQHAISIPTDDLIALARDPGLRL